MRTGRRIDPHTKREIDCQSLHLISQYKLTGDVNIRNKVVIINDPIVRAATGQVYERLPRYAEFEFDDLYNTGIIATINCVEKFEIERRILFSTYCTHRIRGAIIDYLRDLEIIPRKLRKYIRIFEGLKLRLERTPTKNELEDELGQRISDNSWKTILSETNEELFRSRYSHAENLLLIDYGALDPERNSIIQERRELIMRVANSGILSQSERIIVELYFFRNWTIGRIASHMRLCKSSVSQYISKARIKILKAFNPHPSYDSRNIH